MKITKMKFTYKQMNGEITYVDLFAGAGGLSEGFIRAGFTPVAHVEMDTAACFTLKTRVAFHFLNAEGQTELYNKYLRKEISREELYSHVPDELMSSVINMAIGPEHNDRIESIINEHLGVRKVDLIVGGPPCQAYSVAGRSRSETRMVGDPRNFLFKEYAKFLGIYKPRFFVFENVLGLLSANGGGYLKEMTILFDKKGYEIKLYKLEAKNFGVLQNRRRIIIFGWLKILSITPPELDEIITEGEFKVSDLLNDLPRLKAGEGVSRFQKYAGPNTEYLKRFSLRNGSNILTQHVARPHTQQDQKIYEIAVRKWNKIKERLNYNDLPEELKTHKNRSSFTDRFKVVAGDLPFSQTVVAHIAKDGHYYIHPDIRQNRSLTVREAARLQSFPDDYYFEGSRTAA